MKNIQNLEIQYLKAKIAYYKGNPLLTDTEFDAIEKILKEVNSKVVNQVGSKRKDFDFPHPTKMLSLAKIQTEDTKKGTNYMEEDFQKWYRKNTLKTITGGVSLMVSPKFDGNAINIIYQGTKLVNILTRGDGLTGKDVTERFRPHVSKELSTTPPMNNNLPDLNITENDVIEIRAEVVIDVKLFNKKYGREFANPRNYVAGVIGKDDYDEVKVSELTIISLHFLVNSKHVNQIYFSRNLFCAKDQNTLLFNENYIDVIKSYEKLRENYKYQLDGVVISFPESLREILGENEHDPEWAIAIKFVPEEAITEVIGIEWGVGKTGELTPVILFKPVQLAGTTVKRASGYNAGYVNNHKIGNGTLLSLHKAGDIIPEIQKIIIKSKSQFPLPTICHSCEKKLTFDGIHLMCNNNFCPEKIAKKLASAANSINIQRVGLKTFEKFAHYFPNLYELILWVRKKGSSHQIECYGFKYKSRSHEIFVDAFKNIKTLTYAQVIVLCGYDNVGRKLSTQIAKEFCGLTPNYAGLERALISKLKEPLNKGYIKKAIISLELSGIIIEKPKEEVMKNKIYICMTGSPKEFGYKTKTEFIANFPNVEEVSLTDPNCNFLITDDLNSSTSKMKKALKKGIEIKTYGEL